MTRVRDRDERHPRSALPSGDKPRSDRKLRAAGRRAAQDDAKAALERMAGRAGEAAGWSEPFAEGYAAELRRLAGRC